MTASIFGAAFDKLPDDMQAEMREQLRIRKFRYLQALKQRGYNPNTKAVIIGDTPGPGRPTTPGYHHTPFYSTKNSSLWVNKLLLEADINENHLLWFNAVLADGTSLDPVHLADIAHLKPKIIVLGGNAEKWVRRIAPTPVYTKVFHPAFAKRFHSKEPYALIDELLFTKEMS